MDSVQNAARRRSAPTSMNEDDELIHVNCGRCGKQLHVRVEDIRAKRTIECEQCARRAPFSVRSVYVAFESEP